MLLIFIPIHKSVTSLVSIGAKALKYKVMNQKVKHGSSNYVKQMYL